MKIIIYLITVPLAVVFVHYNNILSFELGCLRIERRRVMSILLWRARIVQYNNIIGSCRIVRIHFYVPARIVIIDLSARQTLYTGSLFIKTRI